MAISVFGYINCKSIGTSLDLRYSLSFCLSQCTGILSVILRVYVRPLIRISFSLIMSEFVYQCPAILSLIVGLLIRVSLFEGFYSAITIETDCTCLLIRLCLSVCLSQHPGILSVICMYVNKCDQRTQRVIALKIYLFDFACIRTFLDSYFFISLFVSECV